MEEDPGTKRKALEAIMGAEKRQRKANSTEVQAEEMVLSAEEEYERKIDEAEIAMPGSAEAAEAQAALDELNKAKKIFETATKSRIKADKLLAAAERALDIGDKYHLPSDIREKLIKQLRIDEAEAQAAEAAEAQAAEAAEAQAASRPTGREFPLTQGEPECKEGTGRICNISGGSTRRVRRSKSRRSKSKRSKKSKRNMGKTRRGKTRGRNTSRRATI